MAGLDSSFIAKALGATLLARTGPEAEFSTCSIDSRSIELGDLFIAMPGERLDGHAFIAEAAARGAKGAICSSSWQGRLPADFALYRVSDPLAAFRRLAGAWRRRLSCPVIAVAGSVGKTTTKDLLAAFMRGRHPNVAATRGSENGYVGIPLTILRAPLDAPALIVEIGIDAPGSMARHLDLVKPTAGIVTAIALEHLATLRNIDTIAREESLCLRHIADHGGIVALNLDDPRLARLLPELRSCQSLHTFSLGGSVHGNDRHLAASLAGCAADIDHRITLSGMGTQGAELRVPLAGEHNAQNAVGAALLALAHGLSVAELRRGLETFVPSDGRSRLRRMRSGASVLCDFYNANPASMAAAMRTAGTLPRRPGGRLIACLGDMLELGEHEERLHRELACALREYEFSAVYCFGPRMRWLADELASMSFSGDIAAFTAIEDLIVSLQAVIGPSDVVLLKASRGMRLERVWDALERSP